MLAPDRSDLEPLLDDDVEPEEVRPRPRRPGAWVLLLAIVVSVAGVAGAVEARQRLDATEAALARARAEAAQAVEARDRASEGVRAAAIAEAERERARDRADEAEIAEATASRFVLRDPIVTLPASVTRCRAADLEVLHPGGPVHGLLVANRSRRPCGLLDHPPLEGLDEGGRWRTIPVQLSMASSYTDGPAWTGVLPPGMGVLLAIDQRPPLRNGVCLSGDAPPEDFSGLRLVLDPQGPPLVVPDATFSVGPCRPEVLLWAYDHLTG